MSQRRYSRLVVKISGESLGHTRRNTRPMAQTAQRLLQLHESAFRVAVVVGGGNYFRRSCADDLGVSPDVADDAGMLGSTLNAVFLFGVLTKVGAPTRLFTSGPGAAAGEPLAAADIRTALDDHTIALVGAGLGVGGISTDIAAVEVADMVDADAIIMSKFGVNAVYDRDPRVHPLTARPLRNLTASEALARNLGVMDREALARLVEIRTPMHVVAADSDTAIWSAAHGRRVGSLILGR